MNTTPPLDAHEPIVQNESRWLEVVERQVSALKYGYVHITVHDGRIVQIETTARVRFDKVP